MSSSIHLWHVLVLSLRAAARLWLLFGLGVSAALALGAASAGQPVLAFVSDRASGDQIYLSNAERQWLVQLTHNPGDRSHPAWGAAERLLYASYPAPLHLEMIDLSASQQHLPLRRGLDAEYQPAWSFDGRIAAATNPNLDWDIVIYDMHGARSLAAFNTPHNELEPCWWPDGRLSFVSNRSGDDEIYVYDFAGDALTNLSDHPADDYNPACGRDGRLAFTSTRDYNAEVYIADQHTASVANVSRSRASDFNPAWLPDGRLSFVSDRDGNREIYVLDLEGGSLSNITQNAADDDQPAWSR